MIRPSTALLQRLPPLAEQVCSSKSCRQVQTATGSGLTKRRRPAVGKALTLARWNLGVATLECHGMG